MQLEKNWSSINAKMAHSEWTIYRVQLRECQGVSSNRQKDLTSMLCKMGTKDGFEKGQNNYFISILILSKDFLWPFVRGQSLEVNRSGAVMLWNFVSTILVAEIHLFPLAISIWHSKIKSTSYSASLLPFETSLSLAKQDLAAAGIYHKECLHSLGTLSSFSCIFGQSL